MAAAQSTFSAVRSDCDGPYRVLIVDDSAVIRGLISRWIESDAEIEVVGSAANGLMALNSIRRHGAEVVVLDIEMPEMDGLTVLPKLLEMDPDIKIIMASTLTRRGAEISLRALEAGAADYVPKPESTRDTNAAAIFRQTLVAKVKALGAARRRAISRRPATSARTQRSSARATITIPPPVRRPIRLRSPSARTPAVLAVGSSTGGPHALFSVFTKLDADFRVPTLVTQHMPATFTAILAEHLSRTTRLPCSEAKDGECLRRGHIYIAPGDYHMIVSKRNGELVTELNQDEPVNFCRPSVDKLFWSIAEHFGPSSLGVVLTGMGQDGLAGGRKLVEAGGTLIAQNETTSVVWGMPGAVATDGICSAVLPLDEIGPKVVRIANGGGA